MANIVFKNTGSSIKVIFGDKIGDYGFKELEIPKNSTPLIVEEDNAHLSFYSNGDKVSVNFNDVDTPEDATSASELRDKLSDFFFKEGLLIAQYPPSHSATHVKSTTENASSGFEPFKATNPSLSLTGSSSGSNTWFSASGSHLNNRFHIDLGSVKIITDVRYNNQHSSGGSTEAGAKSLTMWGSNDASSFAELTYATDTGWTELVISVSQLDQHSATDEADTKSFAVINSVAYKYYAFKIANNWGHATLVGIRHIELLSRF